MSHLRLVPDPDQPKPVEPERPRKPCGPKKLTPEQTGRLAALLRNLRRRYHSFKCVAELLDFSEQNVRMVARRRPGYRGSPIMAARAAALAGIPVEQVLTGGLHQAGKCPTCSQPWPEKEGRTENR